MVENMEEQGDPYFEKIERAARHLAGTTQEVSQQQTQPSDPNAEQLWQQRQWLHQQILEHQGALNAAKDDKPPSSNDLENLQMRASDLHTNLLEAETDSSLRNLILQRLQLSNTLSSTLFPLGGYGEATPEEERIRKRITELLEKQVELGSAILRIHQEIQELTPDLEQTRNESNDLLKSNRELMWNVQQVKTAPQNTPKKTDRQLKRLQATYDQTLSKIKMVRHVFQALILGSGVNWGADKATMDLMISLGKPIEQQLEPV